MWALLAAKADGTGGTVGVRRAAANQRVVIIASLGAGEISEAPPFIDVPVWVLMRMRPAAPPPPPPSGTEVVVVTLSPIVGALSFVPPLPPLPVPFPPVELH